MAAVLGAIVTPLTMHTMAARLTQWLQENAGEGANGVHSPLGTISRKSARRRKS